MQITTISLDEVNKLSKGTKLFVEIFNKPLFNGLYTCEKSRLVNIKGAYIDLKSITKEHEDKYKFYLCNIEELLLNEICNLSNVHSCERVRNDFLNDIVERGVVKWNFFNL